MVSKEDVRKRADALAEKAWDIGRIQTAFSRLTSEGIPGNTLSRDEILSHKHEVLDRIQRRAEEYEYLSHSCAKGAALAVMEEFGLGNMAVIKALSPFPGFGMTGLICGAVTGGLIALGLYFGSDDLVDYEGTGRTMSSARVFIPRFEEEVGSVFCPTIQEDLIFGRYMDPRGSQGNFEAFKRSKGYEKCALLPGIGARIASQIIIENMEDTAG